LASRRSATEEAWTPYSGVQLFRAGERFHVMASFLPAPRALSDRFALGADGCFEWRGRRENQIKIAGKRITLDELNTRLLAIPGVEDGGFVISQEPDKRPAAVVVAPTLEPKAIR